MDNLFKYYKDVKAKHPEHMRIMNGGEAYFLFEEDAVNGSKALGIQLDKRTDLAEIPVHVAKFPKQRLDDYLPMLIRKGYRVALCDACYPMKHKAKARVKVLTEAGSWYLMEIRGLKEGTVVEGIYNPQNGAFDFYWNGEGAMVWIGENGELINE